MTFRINSKNIKQAFSVQVIFITEIKLQKEHFLAKEKSIFVNLFVDFEPLLGWNVPTYATTKELKKMAFEINSQNIEQNFEILVTFITEINP